MITCIECHAIIDELIQTEADSLSARLDKRPDMQQGTTFPCSLCGRNWVLAVAPMGFEGDFIPEGAVLIEDHNPELTELNEREGLEEEFFESLRTHEKEL